MTPQDFEQWLVRKSRELSTPFAPSKRSTRHRVERRSSHRLVSRAQDKALHQTNNLFKAGLMSASQAEREFVDYQPSDPSRLTRNVGPSDLDKNYSHGKRTV